MNAPAYAEIGITTNFSFLRGGSDPRSYVHQAGKLGLPVIGIADHNSLAGVVRAYKELENPKVKRKPKLLIGTRIVFIDGTPDILVYPSNREAYGRLCPPRRPMGCVVPWPRSAMSAPSASSRPR
jgi:error-prone DNA polymerase